jgi:hypothetical protein
MAIWSLVLSILTRDRIDQSSERGRGLAIAGIIVGVITLLFAIGTPPRTTGYPS